jgi:hypothetical protein
MVMLSDKVEKYNDQGGTKYTADDRAEFSGSWVKEVLYQRLPKVKNTPVIWNTFLSRSILDPYETQSAIMPGTYPKILVETKIDGRDNANME